MKQLTQEEFDALPSDRPLDARVDGVPPINRKMLIWFDGDWIAVGYCGMGWKLESEGPFGIKYLEIIRHPIYHKLPADYVEGE